MLSADEVKQILEMMVPSGGGTAPDLVAVLHAFLEDPGQAACAEEFTSCTGREAATELASDIFDHAETNGVDPLPTRWRGAIVRMLLTAGADKAGEATTGRVQDARETEDSPTKPKAARVIDLESPEASVKATAIDDLIDRIDLVEAEQLAKEAKIVAANGVATITEVAQVSALLELGISVTATEAEGMYGKDWRTSPQAKAQHKARILGFFGCKSFNDMNEHFGMCVAVAASQGYPAVAVRINQMWTEGTASLGTDFKALMAYYTCFFTRTHLGQGIPVTIDPNLVVRFKA